MTGFARTGMRPPGPRTLRSTGEFMIRWSFWFVVTAAFSAGACGSTTTPSTTTTTVVPTLTITPTTGALMIGQVLAYSVTNAAATDVITWTSSDASILTVDSAGNATGIARGTATLTAASSGGQSATQQVQVVPNYQGTWTGKATMTACTDIGGFVTNSYCAKRVGASQTLTMQLSQISLAIAGTIALAEPGGQVSGSVTGVIGAGGDITTMIGTLSGVVDGANQTLTIISWNSLASGASITGNWAANVTSPQVVGFATAQWQFTGIPRVSTTSVPGGSLGNIAPMVVRP